MLTLVSTEVQSTIDLVNTLVADLDTEGTLDGAAEIVTGLIAEVQTLLADVQALAGVVDVGDTLSTVTGLVQQLIDTLTGLLNEVSVPIKN